MACYSTVKVPRIYPSLRVNIRISTYTHPTYAIYSVRYFSSKTFLYIPYLKHANLQIVLKKILQSKKIAQQNFHDQQFINIGMFHTFYVRTYSCIFSHTTGIYSILLLLYDTVPYRTGTGLLITYCSVRHCCTVQ